MWHPHRWSVCVNKKWKKGDVLVPKLQKPVTDTQVEIVECRRGRYLIKDQKGKKEEIEAKYLDGGYINEDGAKVYDWIKQGEKNASKSKRQTKPRTTKTNSTIQKDDHS